MADHHLVKIDAAHVASNLEDYNSSFHDEPSVSHLAAPDEKPQHFSRWLPLIAQSRSLSLSNVQKVTFSPAQARLLVTAAGSSMHTRVLNRVYAEELESDIVPSLAHLTFPPEGLFARLDACSPKDGVRGAQPLHSIDDILLCLTTSGRARNALLGKLDTDSPIEIFFLPFDARMDTKREFRVFCFGGRITAVSQYKWHQPSFLSDRSDDEREAAVKEMMKEIQRVYEDIVEQVSLKDSSEGDLIMKQGWTFDVLFPKEEPETWKAVLVELNSFGATSGCGACLFHWIRDLDVLYGARTQDVEFRISI